MLLHNLFKPIANCSTLFLLLFSVREQKCAKNPRHNNNLKHGLHDLNSILISQKLKVVSSKQITMIHTGHAKLFQGKLVNHTCYLVDCFAKFVECFCRKWQNKPSGNSHTLLNYIKTQTFDTVRVTLKFLISVGPQ